MFISKQIECRQCKGTGSHEVSTFKNNWYLLLFLCLLVIGLTLMTFLSIWLVNTFHMNIEEFFNFHPIKFSEL